MIRLGSLAGYPFEGPRTLAGWIPPHSAAVFAIMTRLDPEKKPQQFAVIYVGHAQDMSNDFPLSTLTPRVGFVALETGSICIFVPTKCQAGFHRIEYKLRRNLSRYTAPVAT